MMSTLSLSMRMVWTLSPKTGWVQSHPSIRLAGHGLGSRRETTIAGLAAASLRIAASGKAARFRRVAGPCPQSKSKISEIGAPHFGSVALRLRGSNITERSARRRTRSGAAATLYIVSPSETVRLGRTPWMNLIMRAAVRGRP